MQVKPAQKKIEEVRSTKHDREKTILITIAEDVNEEQLYDSKKLHKDDYYEGVGKDSDEDQLVVSKQSSIMDELLVKPEDRDSVSINAEEILPKSLKPVFNPL